MGRNADLSRSDVQRILRLVQDKGWNHRQNGEGSYLIFPPEGPPMTLRHSRSGAFITYRELRARGLEADPARLNNGSRFVRPGNKSESLFDESWVPSEDVREAKGLTPGFEPSDTAKKFTFSAHALERMNQRGVHVFEVYAAIDNYDYCRDLPSHDDYRALVRGDVEVVVNFAQRRVVTVIDLNRNVRTSPRVPIVPAPAVPPEVEDVKPTAPAFIAPNTETEEADAITASTPVKRGRKAGQRPYTDLVREHLANLKAGTLTSNNEIRAAVPSDAPGSPAAVAKLMANLKRYGYVKPGKLRGEWFVVNPRLIAETQVDKHHIIKVHREFDPEVRAKGNAVRRGEIPSVRERIGEFLDTVSPGEEFTNRFIADLLGDAGVSTVAQVLKKLVDGGVLSSRMEGGTTIYAKPSTLFDLRRFIAEQPVGGEFSISQAMAATGALMTRHKMRAELDAMVEAGDLVARGVGGANRAYVRPGLVAPPAPVKIPSQAVYDDDDVDVEPVAIGFEFQPLPDSFVYEVAAVVKRHMNELQDHPGDWVRISLYEGARGADVARKRAAKVEEYLDNPNLQFVVRAMNEEQVGLFVRWRSTVESVR